LEEYVLIFSDGYIHISLHADSERKIKELVQKVTKISHWDFNQSCCCDRNSQRVRIARYYHSRGIFHLRKALYSQARLYLREAYDMEKSKKHKDDYGVALIAVRKARGEDLDIRMSHANDAWPQVSLNGEEGALHRDYEAFVGHNQQHFRQLSHRLELIQNLGNDGEGWSHADLQTTFELEAIQSNFRGSTELPGDGLQFSRQVDLEATTLAPITPFTTTSTRHSTSSSSHSPPIRRRPAPSMPGSDSSLYAISN
jgi:hypothetical protein